MPLSPLNQADLSNIRLIASDVDGTLTQDGKFSTDFISALIDLQSAGIIPKHQMATPFGVFKTLTGFGFQFTKVLPLFRELVLDSNQGFP